MSRFRPLLPFFLCGVAAVGAQFLLSGLGLENRLSQLTMALYYAIVVIGLCLLMGYAGQVSLGHGAFFAIGGYATAVLTTVDLSPRGSSVVVSLLRQMGAVVQRQDLFGSPILTVSPWAAFAVALVVTGVVACLIGYPALRLKGHYLAMATLGFGLIVNKTLLGTALFGAADGINGVPPWTLLPGLTVCGDRPERVKNYYIACGLVLLILLLMRNLLRSRFGRALQAIHDRETAANAMGIDTATCKLQAFVVSALLAAVAGVFFTHFTAGIGPSEAGAIKSVRYLALAAAGGMANLWGVTAVSVMLNYLSLRGLFGSYDHAVFGGILILIVSLAPEGPLKPLGDWLRRLLRRPPAAGSERRPGHGAA